MNKSTKFASGSRSKRQGQLTLLITLTMALASLIGSTTSAVSQVPQQKPGTDDLCRNLTKIRRIPFADEPVNDDVYNKVAQAGPAIVPCLVDRITDVQKMHDPRSEPVFADFRVGDLSFFLLIKLQKVPFEAMLPPEVQAQLKDEGVYAYFRYVSRVENRRALQKKVRMWLQERANRERLNVSIGG